MQAHRLERLIRTLLTRLSRRETLAGLVALGLSELLPPAQASASPDRKWKRGQGSVRAAQGCYPGTPCIGPFGPIPGSNLAQCYLASSSVLKDADCSGCNLTGANLTGADASSADLEDANLSNACLVETNFTGAWVKNTVAPRWAPPLYCRTIMADGKTNNSGCLKDDSCCPVCICDDPHCFLMKWGSKGNGNGQFSYPIDIAVDPKGRVYVVDSANYRIQRFSATGSLLGQWGSYGSGNGQFKLPEGVALAPNGQVYVADSTNVRIQWFTATGGYLSQWGNPGDPGTGDGEFRSPTGVAVAPDGLTVYVTDKVKQLDPTVNPVQRFTATMSYLDQWGSYGKGNSQFSLPHSVAVAPNGHVYVADTGNDRIQWFTASGGYLDKWGSFGSGNGQFNNPYDVAVAPNGEVYVADSNNHRIQRFTADGTYLSQWGSKGSGDGQFQYPGGVVLAPNGQTVYVADTLNHRVQAFCEKIISQA